MEFDHNDRVGFEKKYFDNNFINEVLHEARNLVQFALEEDLGTLGDVSTDSVVDCNETGKAKIYAKQQGVFSGGFFIYEVFKTLDPNICVSVYVKEGEHISNAKVIAEIKGKISTILKGERTALNFISRMSGISTYTNKFVQIAQKYNIQVLDTRKTIPGWRYLDKYGVRLGGAFNHRIGLFDMVMLKDNHISTAGGIVPAIRKCKQYLKENSLLLKIEVETKNMIEVTEANKEGVDRIMLDNMNVAEIKQAVNIINGKTEIEISGGVDLDNFEQLASTGVDFISVGRITHSAAAFDFSMLMEIY